MDTYDKIPDAREKIILDSINEGVFTVDLDWNITSFNRAAEEITGVDRSDAIGRPCSEVFRANICETACAIRNTLASGRPVVNGTAYIINRLGQRIPVRISTALVNNDRGDVVGGVETFQDLSRIEQLQKQLQEKYTFEDIIGKSPPMKKLFEVLPQIAQSDGSVLILGDSGTGKELFARAIHNISPRKDGPFVAVNCGALPDTLLESELFGYVAGAFTDAKKNKPGRFAMADGGTIFLDEIGDISPAMQIRLLRVLQERTIEPLGAVKPVKVDVRVVAATNKELQTMISEGNFRDDLYYRIRVVQLDLPKLRERRQDIPVLIDHLIAKFNKLFERDITGVSPEVMAMLMEYEYPGNIRELENIIEHAFILSSGELIELQHLPPEFRPSSGGGSGRPFPPSLREMERYLIADTLRRYKGNRTKTARDLGIDTSTLYRKMKALQIDPPESDGRSRRM